MQHICPSQDFPEQPQRLRVTPPRLAPAPRIHACHLVTKPGQQLGRLTAQTFRELRTMNLNLAGPQYPGSHEPASSLALSTVLGRDTASPPRRLPLREYTELHRPRD